MGTHTPYLDPYAKWSPGSWTPARCTLWQTLPEDRQHRMVAWVMAEKEQGRCHKFEVPYTKVEEPAEKG